MTDAGAPADPIFETHRAALRGAAYRIMGTIVDADDVLQDAWLRWRVVDLAGVDDARRYLFRIVTNVAIDHLRRAQARREEYLGVWLPEPVVTASDGAGVIERVESLEFGLLVVLQTLAPSERVVYVLREAFGFSYAEISSMVGRTEHAVRQVGYRARSRVGAQRPRHRTSADEHRRLTREFLAAAQTGDVSALLDLLAPGATMRPDANGRSEMPLRPLVGAEAIAEYFASVVRFWPSDARPLGIDVNGRPGILVVSSGTPYMLFVLEPAANGAITVVDVIRSETKLAHTLDPPVGPDELR